MASTDSRNTSTIQSCQNDAPSKVKLAVHNQCPGIELASPVYAGDGVTCCLSPDQRVDAGSTMQVVFSINFALDESIGIFMYKIQRKNNDLSNEDAISGEEEAICTQHIFIWKIYKSGSFHVYADLIEHDRDFVWGKDMLMKLAAKYELFDIQYSPVEHTWFIYDTTELTTSLNVTREKECYKLEMTISERSTNDGTWKPRYIDMNV
jgi:hypothetical protein